MASGNNPLIQLRETVMQWPEVTEKLSHGSPTFWGGKKTLCEFSRRPSWGWPNRNLGKGSEGVSSRDLAFRS